MTTLPIPVALAFLLAGAFGAVPRGKSARSRCEDIDVPFCKSLPYKTTQDANQNGRNRLVNISSLMPRDVNSHMNCSKDLAHMLCLYHLPVCLPDLVLRPCRGFCRRVQASCRQQIAALDAGWLINVDCGSLPEFNTSACINSSDESLRPLPTTTESLGPLPTTTGVTPPPTLKPSKCHQKNRTQRHFLLLGKMCNKDGSFKAKQCLEEPYGCYCVDSNGDMVNGTQRHNSAALSCPSCTCAKNRSKLTKQLYLEGDYDFAIKAKILSQRRLKKKQYDGKVTLITVMVQKIWKSGNVVIKENTKATLRYNAMCLCPKMERNKQYIICGYEDASRGLLRVTQDGTVENFAPKYNGRLPAWERAKRRMLRGISKNNSKKRRRLTGR